jgi:hypothetical protein
LKYIFVLRPCVYENWLGGCEAESGGGPIQVQ